MVYALLIRDLRNQEVPFHTELLLYQNEALRNIAVAYILKAMGEHYSAKYESLDDMNKALITQFEITTYETKVKSEWS